MSEKHPGDKNDAFASELGPGLTKRQYAAIHLRVPDSGIPWLDAMIDRSRRDEFAGQAMAGFCGAPNLASTPASDIADWCVETADAMLAELGKGETP